MDDHSRSTLHKKIETLQHHLKRTDPSLSMGKIYVTDMMRFASHISTILLIVSISTIIWLFVVANHDTLTMHNTTIMNNLVSTNAKNTQRSYHNIWSEVQIIKRYEITLGNRSNYYIRTARYWTIIAVESRLYAIGNSWPKDRGQKYIWWNSSFDLHEMKEEPTFISKQQKFVHRPGQPNANKGHNVAFVKKHNSDEIIKIGGMGLGIYLHDELHYNASPVISANHSGCIDVRTWIVGCIYDGGISIVYLHDSYYLYARANVNWGGGRHVHVAQSKDLVSWTPFEMITFLNYFDEKINNIYWPAVKENPIDKNSVVAFFPISFKIAHNEWVGGIYIAISCDGINFSHLLSVKKTNVTSDGNGHTYDHPVSGLIQIGDYIRFWVHANLHSIVSQAQGVGHYSRLEAYDIPLHQFEMYVGTEKTYLPSCQ